MLWDMYHWTLCYFFFACLKYANPSTLPSVAWVTRWVVNDTLVINGLQGIWQSLPSFHCVSFSRHQTSGQGIFLLAIDLERWRASVLWIELNHRCLECAFTELHWRWNSVVFFHLVFLACFSFGFSTVSRASLLCTRETNHETWYKEI